MIVSFGTSAFNSRIKQRELTQDELYDILAKEPILRNDKDGPYFIMASFEINKRRASAVKEYYGATIDLDDTSLTLEEIKETFKKYSHCIYTTHNHVTKGNRYRLVMPYKKPVSPEQHVTAMLVLMHELGLDDVDTSSKALSRPMYLPSCPRKMSGHAEYYENVKKKKYDASKVEISPELQFAIDESKELKEKFDPNEKYNEGGRNEALTRLVGKFIHNGMDLHTCLASARAWSDANCSPPLNDDEIETIVNSVFNSHKRNNKDSGWGYDELVRRIKNTEDITESLPTLITLIAASHNKITNLERDMLIKSLSHKSKVAGGSIKNQLEFEVNKRKAVIEDEEAEEEEELTTKKLKKEFDNYVFLARDNRMLNLDNGEIYKPEGFNNNFSYMVPKGGVLQLLLKHHCVKKADMIMYNPTAESVFTWGKTRYANRYTPSELKPREGKVTKMLRHFRKLIPNSKERNALLDYIAFIVQNPGTKVLWMPIIKGGKGIGKSIIANEILVPILGHKNVKTPMASEIGGQFNSWMLDTQLIIFHELKLGNTRREKLQLTDSLKEVITEPMLSATYKGIDSYQVFNFANVIGFTNYDDCIMYSEDERRFLMIRSDMKPQTPRYYTNLITWLRKHQRQMLDYFQNRDVSNFSSAKPIETAYSEEIKEESIMFPSSALRDALDDPKHPFNTDGMMLYHHIVDYLSQTAVGADVVKAEAYREKSNAYQLTNALRACGFRKYQGSQDGRISYHGKREALWIAPNFTKQKYDTWTVKKRINKQVRNWEF